MDDDTADAAWAQCQTENAMFEVLKTLYSACDMADWIDPDWPGHYRDAEHCIEEFRQCSPVEWLELLNELAHEAGLEKQYAIK